MNDNVEVSVVVVTYNSIWDKLRQTLESILTQDDIRMQIIVADDGSDVRHDSNIIEIMKKYEFDNYVITNSETNQGTVENIYRAVKNAKGKYIKTIAPGDLLYHKETLRKWFDFMKKSKAVVSFGDAVYYCASQNGVTLFPTKGSPIKKELYTKEGKYKDIFIDYLLANDTILGAAQMMESDAIQKYLELIKSKIIYAEDYMIRIMIFDNLRVCYFPHTVVWYEYGTGISTNNDSKWERLLYKDYEMSDRLIGERKEGTNAITKRYLKYLRKSSLPMYIKKIYKVVMFPKILYFRRKMKAGKKKLPRECDIEILKKTLSC
ncbi:glycosyltransferase family A protein [Candidatus Merdisoma sp. HCP28S3_D10]|uniref:glycosyltransferase family A protein n=1 Tax=unclassified Candidatus Merdisoma TaxID=3099611 RepID=UPI003F8C33E3